MKLLLRFVSAALLLTSALRGDPGQPPPSILLPDNVATTATGRTVGGKPWGYVVVQPSDPTAFAGKRLRIHLKPAAIAAAGTFSLLGEIQPVTEQATLQALMQRAVELGDDAGTVNGIIDSLAKEWAQPGQILPPGSHRRLAALVNRAATSERDAATLRALSLNHPTFRLALGLAWGGPLPVAGGTVCTIEVREAGPDGTDLAVVGRCQFTAGQPAVLATPAAPVQVPDLTPEGHLTVKLRWAVPDVLRRQALQTTGFRVWRVPGTATLSDPPTLAQVQATAGMKQITIAPILLGKLFSAGDVGNFTADPATFFVADDNGRDDFIDTQTVPGGPPILQRTGTAHAPDTEYRYYVAALDWLKQPGPLSMGGDGIAVRTLPPPIPQNLQVQERHLGVAATDIRLQLSFDRNRNNIAGVTPTQRYAIYRGDSGPQSLDKRNYLLPNPDVVRPPNEPGMNPLAMVNQPSGIRASFRDDALSPAGNQTKTFWYCVRSIHDTALGPVYSAPSAPVFGTFHDYRGPDAPGGSVHTDALRALCRDDSSGYAANEPIGAGDVVAAKGRTIRMVANRRDPGVVAAQFFVIDPRSTNTVTAPVIYFAPGNDQIVFDSFFLDSDAIVTRSDRMVYGAICLAKNGSASYVAWRQLVWGTGGIVASTTHRTRLTFECATAPTSQLDPASSLSAKMLELAPFPTLTYQGDTVRAALPSAAQNGRTAVVTITRSGVTTRQALKVADSKIVFSDPGRSAPNTPAATYSLRLVRSFQDRAVAPANPNSDQLPPGWPLASNWPPPPPETEHVSGEIPSTVSVSVSLTPETKEYQVYRQVDASPMTMIAEGVAEYETDALKEIVVADKPNLPVSGRIGYFARLVDRHGNASPLKQIGSYIDLLAPTPIPVLNEPVAAGSSAAPKMQLSWFCPPQGVRRFNVRLVDLTSGVVVASSPGANIMAQIGADVRYAVPSPAGVPSPVIPQGSNFATTASPHETAGAPSVHTAEFSVQLNHEYHVEIEAVGLNPADTPRSLPRKFLWRAPVASGAVAWPARPLPKVINGVPLNFQARELSPSNPYFASVYAAPTRISDGDATPVLIPIGLAPINGFEFTNTGALHPRQIEYGMPKYTVNADSPLYRGSRDPNAYVYPIFSAGSSIKVVPLLPVVLYRQIVSAQGFDYTNIGELVQCSPMITRIAWRDENPGATVVDPLIVTLPSYGGGAYTSATFWLPDSKPVVRGYTYRYFLVRFTIETGEIDQVIDCGTVTPSY